MLLAHKYMKISELIELLKIYNQDSEVKIQDDNSNNYEIETKDFSMVKNTFGSFELLIKTNLISRS